MLVMNQRIQITAEIKKNIKEEAMKKSKGKFNDMMYYDDEDYEEDWEQYEAQVEEKIASINSLDIFKLQIEQGFNVQGQSIVKEEEETKEEKDDEFDDLDSEEDETFKVHNDKVEIDMVLDMNEPDIMKLDEF